MLYLLINKCKRKWTRLSEHNNCFHKRCLANLIEKLRLAQGVLDNTVRVPQRAVMQSPQGSTVYVIGQDGMVAVRPVKTGGFSGSDWVISSGLQAGDQVIVEGLQKVRPGALAKAVPFGASAVASAPAAR